MWLLSCGVYHLIVVTINENFLNSEVQSLAKAIKNQRELLERFTGEAGVLHQMGPSLDIINYHMKPTTLQLRPPCKRYFFVGSIFITDSRAMVLGSLQRAKERGEVECCLVDTPPLHSPYHIYCLPGCQTLSHHPVPSQ